MSGLFKKLKFIGLILFPLLLLTSINCKKNKEIETNVSSNEEISKYNGVSFVGSVNEIEQNAMDPIIKISANSLTLMPFGFISGASGKVQWGNTWQWWGEKKVGIRQCIKFAHNKGLKVMVKPQVWISNGGWNNSTFTGDYEMSDEAGWEILEETYYNFIIDFAVLAEEENAEAFCVGTEWGKFFQIRPSFWNLLIDSCRSKFSGKLTYAGNWDSYKFFPHWPKLDYIGVDAYFPLSENQTASIEECEKAWKPYFEEIHSLSLEVDRPVIFTEYGYRSMDFTTKAPWFSGSDPTLNLTAQENAYTALYNTFWTEPWFKGGFLWKWFDFHSKAGGVDDNNFTPQNKPVIDIIKRFHEEN